METWPVKVSREQNVDELLRRISALVAERQELRGHADRVAELEQNRAEIVRCQRELNHALIELYGRRAA